MTEHDVDPPCERCGLRIFSSCCCPKAEPTDHEKQLGRVSRMTHAELEHARRAGR
jgi:hypothetical protein